MVDLLLLLLLLTQTSIYSHVFTICCLVAVSNGGRVPLPLASRNSSGFSYQLFTTAHNN
jgi:hypothetical protein